MIIKKHKNTLSFALDISDSDTNDLPWVRLELSPDLSEYKVNTDPEDNVYHSIKAVFIEEETTIFDGFSIEKAESLVLGISEIIKMYKNASKKFKK